MDALTLLHHAVNVGLRVEAIRGNLLVQGPKRLEPVVKLLAEHKAEVLAVLSRTANSTELLVSSPRFGRVILSVEGEPALELPCAARRGRVQLLEGLFLHFCCKCGAYGAFGHGVSLRSSRLGRWYCAEHRPSQLRGRTHG
jgi:hypothetical protein